MKILLFGGFLGSGKTSSILKIAAQITETRKETVAIIENEIGEAGIDDQLLKGSGLQVKPLFGGCVCCQITSDLITAIREIHETIHPDWLIIEMTGLAIPGKTAELIRTYCNCFSMCKTVTLVDGGRWWELKEVLEPLMVEQVKDCNLLLVNKTDLIGSEASKVASDLREICSQVPILLTSASQPMFQAVIEEVLRVE
jgi:G3E family GTPase